MSSVPDKTPWEKKCGFACCNLNYVPRINKYFCNHWECQPCIPFLVISLLIITYVSFCFEYFYYLPHSTLSGFYKLTFFFVLLIWSYIATIFEGPGYLPFYFPTMEPPRSCGSKDYLSGLVTTDEQEAFIKSQTLPPRTCFFHSARRIVIRPDHYCNWIQTFIGKKNEKLFFLILFYGFCYCSLFFLYDLRAIYYVFKSNSFTPLMIFSILFLIIAIIFEIYLFTESIQQFISIITNFTTFDRLKQQYFQSNGCMSNFQEVFGSWKQILLWPFPIGAFCGIDEYLLATELESLKKLV